MGTKASLMLQDEEIRQIGDATGFSAQQIEKLYSRFTQLDRANCGSLDRNDLLSIPELAINPLCDRLIEMFFYDHSNDKELERINFKQFMRVLAAFRNTSNQPTNNNNNNNNNQVTAVSPGFVANSARLNFNLPPSTTEYTNTPVTTQGRRTKIVDPREGSLIPNRTQVYNDNDNQRRLTTNRLTQSSSRHNDTTDRDLQRNNKNDNNKRNKKNKKNNVNNQQQQQRQLDSLTLIVDSLSDCLKDKLYFIFKIYDVDNDGRISFNDLKGILKMMVGNYIEDVQLDKIATRAFVEVDKDNDGFVDFNEFCQVFAGKDMDEKLRVRFF